MGAIKGTVTVRRYLVRGKPSDRAKLLKGARAHALLPIDPAGDVEKAHGWALAHDPDDVELTSDAVFTSSGSSMLLALRVDTLRPPAAVVKRMVAEKLKALGRKTGRRDKQEAKDWVVRSLRSRAFPVTRAVDVVWQLDEQRLFFFSHGKGANELLIDLFFKSFGLELVPAGPGAVAGRGALPAARQSRAHARAGVRLRGPAGTTDRGRGRHWRRRRR
jgi:recombination associated protein RdgC